MVIPIDEEILDKRDGSQKLQSSVDKADVPLVSTQ